jgi:hypothetical protein
MRVVTPPANLWGFAMMHAVDWVATMLRGLLPPHLLKPLAAHFKEWWPATRTHSDGVCFNRYFNGDAPTGMNQIHQFFAGFAILWQPFNWGHG